MVDFTPSAPSMGGNESVGFKPSLDQGMATLARSQKISDMQMQANQAKQQADQMNTPSAIAGETAKGTLGSLADNGLRFLQSAVRAPGDIFNVLRGKTADSTVQPNFSGTGQQTFQGEFQDKTMPAVESGQQSPLGATLRTTGGVVGGGLDVLGAEGLPGAVKGTAVKAKGLLSGLLEKTGVKGLLDNRASQKATQTAINAVDNTLKGKKLESAFQKVGTGDRTATPKTFFSEQTLHPDVQTVKLGTRLKGVLTSKDPVENLTNAAKEFDTTEKAIDTHLTSGDPEIQYNAQKPALMTALETAKTSAPEEYKTIKDLKSAYDSVINYAQKTVERAEDTPKGVRDARQAFDAQARREFPSAYKDGNIDLKTPAGNAIRKARDVMNAHFYDIAPEGSKIKSLVSHETDLYNAIKRIAPSAKDQEGKTGLKELIAKHPWITGLATAGVGGAVGAEVKSHL